MNELQQQIAIWALQRIARKLAGFTHFKLAGFTHSDGEIDRPVEYRQTCDCPKCIAEDALQRIGEIR